MAAMSNELSQEGNQKMEQVCLYYYYLFFSLFTGENSI